MMKAVLASVRPVLSVDIEAHRMTTIEADAVLAFGTLSQLCTIKVFDLKADCMLISGANYITEVLPNNGS
jgi:hypothetical protein